MFPSCEQKPRSQDWAAATDRTIFSTQKHELFRSNLTISQKGKQCNTKLTPQQQVATRRGPIHGCRKQYTSSRAVLWQFSDWPDTETKQRDWWLKTQNLWIATFISIILYIYLYIYQNQRLHITQMSHDVPMFCKQELWWLVPRSCGVPPWKHTGFHKHQISFLWQIQKHVF